VRRIVRSSAWISLCLTWDCDCCADCAGRPLRCARHSPARREANERTRRTIRGRDIILAAWGCESLSGSRPGSPSGPWSEARAFQVPDRPLSTHGILRRCRIARSQWTPCNSHPPIRPKATLAPCCSGTAGLPSTGRGPSHWTEKARGRDPGRSFGTIAR
jgi:hypothetical protein